MKIEEVKRDMDIVTFVEEYLGIKLFVYQKEILRKIWSTGKMYIHMGQDLDKTDIRPMYEITRCSLINDEVE